jgi:hypothetical protein
MLSGVDGSKHNLFVFKPSLEPSTRSILELLIHLRYNCAVRGGITTISSGTVDVRAFAQVTRIRITHTIWGGGTSEDFRPKSVLLMNIYEHSFA